MAELNKRKVGLSLAIVAGILYIACAILFAISPELALSLFGRMFHGIDISKIAITAFSLADVIIGLIEIVIYSFIAGWLFAAVYNKVK